MLLGNYQIMIIRIKIIIKLIDIALTKARDYKVVHKDKNDKAKKNQTCKFLKIKEIRKENTEAKQQKYKNNKKCKNIFKTDYLNTNLETNFASLSSSGRLFQSRGSFSLTPGLCFTKWD